MLNKTKNFWILYVEIDDIFDLFLISTGSSRSEGTLLYGQEYHNTSQRTIKSRWNSSMLSRDHYGKMDPDGEWLTSKSDFWDDDSLVLEKDTLDLIKPEDIKRTSMIYKRQNQMVFDEEKEAKLKNEVDDEWEKFLYEARKESWDTDELDYAKFRSKRDEEARLEYYRSLVTKDIFQTTDEVKQ